MEYRSVTRQLRNCVPFKKDWNSKKGSENDLEALQNSPDQPATSIPMAATQSNWYSLGTWRLVKMSLHDSTEWIIVIYTIYLTVHTLFD